MSLHPEFKTEFLTRLSQVKKIPLLSRLSPSSSQATSREDLEGFLRAQRLGYECVVEVSKIIQPGWTEKKTAQMMDTFLHDYGIRSFFHRSFAWFGDRTKFHEFKTYLDFLPSKRQLNEKDVVILDTAPIFQSYGGDIGYTFTLQPHPGLEQAKRDLLDLRVLIQELFSQEVPTSRIWRRVDTEIKLRGYENCYEKYPFSVLGHRLHKVPLAGLPSFVRPFGWQSYWGLLSRGLLPELLSREHSGDATGVWAIEPHLGGKDFGAKFEEILVVEKGKAYWLDEEVPHILEATR
jgi:hypothetical protein